MQEYGVQYFPLVDLNNPETNRNAQVNLKYHKTMDIYNSKVNVLTFTHINSTCVSTFNCSCVILKLKHCGCPVKLSSPPPNFHLDIFDIFGIYCGNFTRIENEA